MPKLKYNKQLCDGLRHFAHLMCENPDSYTKEDGKILDRALRSCPGISDIDIVWVRWRYVAEPREWITSSEMIFDPKKCRYIYPEKD